MTDTISNIKFQASSTIQPQTVNYNKRYTAPMPADNSVDDMFFLQAMEQQKAEKKERKKDVWYKTGVTAQVGMAIAFGVMAAASILTYKLNAGKLNSLGEKSVLKFKAIAEDSVPKLTSDSVNPKARDFIKMVKDRTGLDEEVAKYAGTKSAEQCVLFHGPSGTGKTFSAKLMAKELGAEYAEVDFPKIASPYVGQASKNINQVFADISAKAKTEPEKKFLVAFNEIDSMLIPMEKSGTNQSYVLENRTAFLNGLDSIKELKNVKIVGTTNADPKSGNLDLAALSRFGNLFEVQLPTKKEIIASLKWHLRDCKAANEEFFENNKSNIEDFADKLVKKHFSQRDVEKLMESAQTRFGIDIANKSKPLEQKFKMKYLKDALKNKEFTTGSMGKDKSQKEISIQNLTFLQKLLLLFSKNK